MAIRRNTASPTKVMRNGKNIAKIMRNNKVLFEAKALGGFYNANNQLMASFTVEQAEATYTSSSNGLAKTLGLNIADVRKVVVPKGTKKIGAYAFYILTNATSCVLPEGLETIGLNSFNGFGKNATNPTINFPSTLTSIGSSAFQGCGAFPVALPNGLTYIGEQAFYNCAITSVTIPSSLTTINSKAFYYATNVKTLTIPSGVTTIGATAFSYMSSLTSVSIASTVTTIGERAFAWNSKLASLSVPSSVTKIGTNAFQDLAHVYYSGSATGSPWGAKAIN